MPENWFDRFVPRRFQTTRAMRRLSEKVEGLVVQNAESLRWAMLQDLDRAFMRLSSSLDESLEEMICATKGAIQVANDKRRLQANTIPEEASRLRATASELEVLIRDLTGTEPRRTSHDVSPQEGGSL